jgi:hypothetical protein
LKDIKMRASPPVFKKAPSRPDYADLSKPAKERIALAARRLFMMYGVYVPLCDIAELAESNEATAIRHYESHGSLVQVYVRELINENEILWNEAEAGHPDDPEGQLRSWIKGIELMAGDPLSEMCQLSRAIAQMFRWNSSPLLKEVGSERRREFNKIGQLCHKAKFDEPSSLAHKLMLLVDGTRSNSNFFGYAGPHSHLSEAASDLMAVHRGGGKLISPLD